MPEFPLSIPGILRDLHAHIQIEYRLLGCMPYRLVYLNRDKTAHVMDFHVLPTPNPTPKAGPRLCRAVLLAAEVRLHPGEGGAAHIPDLGREPGGRPGLMVAGFESTGRLHAQLSSMIRTPAGPGYTPLPVDDQALSARGVADFLRNAYECAP